MRALRALGIGQARAGLGQHLLLVLVHVHGVRPRWLGLWVRVDFSRSQPPRVVGCIVAVVLCCSGVPVKRQEFDNLCAFAALEQVRTEQGRWRVELGKSAVKPQALECCSGRETHSSFS